MVVSASVKNLALHNGVVRGWASHGADLRNSSNSLIEKLRLSDNGGDGIILGSGSMIKDCVTTANTGSGIRVAGSDTRVEDNHSISNQGNGFRVDGAGNLIVKNSAAGNTGGDYSIAAGSSYGQILQVPGANFTNDVPWANFGTSCPPGQSLCAGACVSLASSPANCGTCGTVCSANNIASPACAAGVCNGACNSGFSDCNGNKQTDGCEVNLNTSLQNCGTCGTVCPAGANGSASCQAGSCGLLCNGGFGNCNLTNGDGCEVNLTSSVSNCGACGVACPGGANASAVCQSSVCGLICSGNFANCDGLTANGCEVNRNTDLNNCGACGNVCSDGLACTTDACTAAVCTYQTQAGFCLIAGVCYANGAVNPGNPCLLCNSAVNNSIWSSASAGTVCVAASCSGSTLTVADTCNGSGVCVDSGTQSCSPYACNGGGTACRTSCTVNGDCVAGFDCASGVCKKSQGQTCSLNNECASAFCVDNVCCNSACSGVCQACSAAKNGGVNGACGNIANNTDPDNECSGGLGTCNGAGACQ